MGLSGKTLGIIHAAVFTANTAEPYAREFLPGWRSSTRAMTACSG